ncbi:Pimeloyl-ACP methyl ester carboxylesterase [Micromonospora citrea]|uniref:Pimeloyl-ACP methyl ester carboxylesterase n=1 Tax=Micromonospora citrea TaxID=47855 RepID=A0A1C6VG51_9ACTN|nr:alpha/beta hydrolase [Micromonospora citrea]SCL64860.1 Pimeloyl-ACP methyl ester carboxylesterase [Micromonospora citrea]
MTSRSRIPLPRSGHARAAVGALAAVGVAAAGLAAERALVRKLKADPTDRYADEVFDEQRYDESFRLEMPDGTDIHVEVVEPTRPTPGNPTVVLVHGFCLDMGTFHFQRKVLAERGEHRIVAYDQPGHGRSGRLETGEYDLTALGRTLREVIDRAAPEGPLVLVGHSMGGMTIMAFAELFPEMFGDRVVGTVLMATSGGLLAETKLVAPALLGRVGAPVLYMVGNVTRYGGTAIDWARRSTTNVAWLLTRRYGFGTRHPSPALVSYVETMNSRTSADTVTRYLRTLATHSRFPALAALAGTPVLVIVGDKDMITPVTHSEEIVRRLPHAGFVKIPDSGHVVMLEHADEVNEALTRFLEEL